MCVCMSGAYVRGCAMSECVCGLELSSGSIQSFTIWEDGGTFFRLGKFGESGVFGQGHGKFGNFMMVVNKTSAVG